mgnify:CR=1 FL=1
MNSELRCRFAPSPTGYLHIGGARTALFNYLLAKNQGGKFILRVEDTDRERSTPEATQAIIDGMTWLGLSYDEGPFFQSERTDLYREYVIKLLESGHAYRCYATAEELETLRNSQMAAGLKPMYDRRFRPESLSPQPTELPKSTDEKKFTIRIRIPDNADLNFEDTILGRIETPTTEIDDFIILRSDGSPTYNFTVVVDDIEMKISHVVRGLDHVPNTPKQIAIYQALNAKHPIFAHCPMILGSDKQKLSKRHGATSVIEYKNFGYLPKAFINYLARLSWSHGDQEIFSIDELIKFFSLSQVGKSPAVFDTVKLDWVNQEHIKNSEAQTLFQEIGFLIKDQFKSKFNIADSNILKLIDALKVRSKNLIELANGLEFYFLSNNEINPSEELKEKYLQEDGISALKLSLDFIQSIKDEDFLENSIENSFKEFIKNNGLKLGKIAQPLRIALTGSDISPPIFTVMEILGKNTTLERIKLIVSS